VLSEKKVANGSFVHCFIRAGAFQDPPSPPSSTAPASTALAEPPPRDRAPPAPHEPARAAAARRAPGSTAAGLAGSGFGADERAGESEGRDDDGDAGESDGDAQVRAVGPLGRSRVLVGPVRLDALRGGRSEPCACGYGIRVNGLRVGYGLRVG
jgi:hypothetical protein